MESLLIVLTLAALLWLALKLVDRAIEYQVGAFSRLIGGWKPEGWPVGVQEEDRDHPWGRGAGRKPCAQPPVTVQSVPPMVHRHR